MQSINHQCINSLLVQLGHCLKGPESMSCVGQQAVLTIETSSCNSILFTPSAEEEAEEEEAEKEAINYAYIISLHL